MKLALLFALLLAQCNLFAQSFTSYFTGDTADVAPATSFGLCLMGGATEEDHAMRWFLQRSGGGDVVVLRSSGGNGYNDYLYTQLGVSVNSVETILFNNATAAFDPYVLRQIANAEAIFIAGGDQSTYVQYWRNTPVDSLINYLSSVKKIPVGGTSAGMAILGWAYNSALNGSLTSAQALANPYAALVTVGQNDFLKLPLMRNTITDTHYDNPDRRGRHMVFLARMLAANGDSVRGIACDEYTAVCIDSTGKARVFGGYPAYDDNAYFLQVNCGTNTPETLASGQPLIWNRNQEAIKVYNIKGDTLGAKWFDVNNWLQASGGAWQNWYVLSGVLNTTAGSPPCNLLPIHLLTFTAGVSQQSAVNSQQSVQLTWTSQNEQTFDHYEVERSRDGRAFFKIGSVKAVSGELSVVSKQSYNFNDLSLLTTHNSLYYRLKMLDKDGSFTYSKTEKVLFTIDHSLFTIFPNPATTSVQLQFHKALVGKVAIEVSDVSGKVLMTKVVDGSDVITLSTGHLIAGIYAVKVVNEGEKYVQKLIIK